MEEHYKTFETMSKNLEVLLKKKELYSNETLFYNFIKDFKASITDIFGGRSGAYERTLQEAKDTALREMEERARRLGANAVVGIDLDYETIGQSSSMLMVSCSGTAVVL